MVIRAVQVNRGFLPFLPPRVAQTADHLERMDHVLQDKVRTVSLELSAGLGHRVLMLETAGREELVLTQGI